MEQGFRHEHKYIISQASAELLKRRLPGFMQYDPHAGTSGQYTIRSLYFDDPHFTAVEDKLSGISDRVKYRLRCYNYDTAFVKLEKKEKHRDLTRKTGQTLTREQAENLQAGKVMAAEKLLQELQQQPALRPAVLVDYDRTPFVCSLAQTRITLDENIRTAPYAGSLENSHLAMIPVLEPGQVVLEVKYNEYLPEYLDLALADIPKIQLAVSKYVLCASVI